MRTHCKQCGKALKNGSTNKRYCSVRCKQKTSNPSPRATKATKKILVVPETTGESRIPLHIVNSGDLYRGLNLIRRTTDYWIFCHSTFWPNEDFSESEQYKFRSLIAEHFNGCENIDDKFKELIQRAILAKRYVEEKTYRYMEPAGAWLNIRFLNGLSGTSKWFEAIQEHRRDKQDFNEGLTRFAEAILKYAEARNIIDIVFYRQVFLKHKEYGLLQLYLNFLIHYQFIYF